jgi:hypothetical protein
MADFTGNESTNAALLATPNGLSSDVTDATQELTTWPLSFRSSPIALSQGTPQPAVSIVHRSVGGYRQELFGGRLFERVIVIPRVKALGFVLSATQFPVEVWNTFRNSDQILTAIVITGSGGVILDDPFGEPLVFGAFDSFIYQATMPSSGPAQINQDIVFTFESGITGAELLITGSRITVFSVAPDWSQGITETIEYLTDVLVAYSDNEQRRALRQLPRRGMKYRALALKARDSAGMESLVWGWQNQPFGVPWWQDQTPLTSDTPAGSFSIPCKTTDRQFAPGGIAVIWIDEYTFEALTIDTVAADHITVTSPTQFSWKAGPSTLVMPVFLARLKSQVVVDRLSSAIDQMDLEFTGEAQQPAPAPSSSLPTYKGFNVLEVAPNWATDLKRTYSRSLVILDPKIGPIAAVDKGGSAIVGQEFPWWLNDHAAVTQFRAFLIAQFGQLRPFWIPTWDQDLVLHQDVLSTDTGIAIESEFYTRFFFPSKARKYIAFIPTDGSGNVYRKVTNASDNGDGTELLTLESPTGKNFSKSQTQISFLTLARLASDESSLVWMNSDLAQANLQLQEVPREVP